MCINLANSIKLMKYNIDRYHLKMEQFANFANKTIVAYFLKGFAALYSLQAYGILCNMHFITIHTHSSNKLTERPLDYAYTKYCKVNLCS